MGSVMLRVASVNRTLGGTRVLDDVSLEVRAGAIVGLIGQNGAGKTTLIRLVMRLTRPDTGSVQVDAARTGYLPEERGLYQRQKVEATLDYLARLKGLSAAGARADIDRWLTRLDVVPLRDRRLEQLSKGQQQKIQLAAAFLGDPALLVLDEPFSGLDPMNARLVTELVREAAARGCGVLVSAHQLALVEQVCTEVVMLARGRVVLTGTMDEIHRRRRDSGESFEDLFMARAESGGAA
jgi:ABC-2 type transport system ATP-binding protein